MAYISELWEISKVLGRFQDSIVYILSGPWFTHSVPRFGLSLLVRISSVIPTTHSVQWASREHWKTLVEVSLLDQLVATLMFMPIASTVGDSMGSYTAAQHCLFLLV